MPASVTLLQDCTLRDLRCDRRVRWAKLASVMFLQLLRSRAVMLTLAMGMACCRAAKYPTASSVTLSLFERSNSRTPLVATRRPTAAKSSAENSVKRFVFAARKTKSMNVCLVGNTVACAASFHSKWAAHHASCMLRWDD